MRSRRKILSVCDSAQQALIDLGPKALLDILILNKLDRDNIWLTDLQREKNSSWFLLYKASHVMLQTKPGQLPRVMS